MTSKSKTKIANFRPRDARGRFIKAVPALKVVEAPKAPAPKAMVVVEVPDLRVEDLEIWNNQTIIPHKEYKKLQKRYDRVTLRNAVAVMVALDVVRLPEAIALGNSKSYRPWMVGQLKVILDHPRLIEVLEWALVSEFATWEQGWAKFPRGGKGKVGPLGFLVNKLNELRKEGRTSIATIKYLAEAVKLLGWIN